MEFGSFNHLFRYLLANQEGEIRLPEDCYPLISLFDQLSMSDQVEVLALTHLKLQIREVQNNGKSSQTAAKRRENTPDMDYPAATFE